MGSPRSRVVYCVTNLLLDGLIIRMDRLIPIRTDFLIMCVLLLLPALLGMVLPICDLLVCGLVDLHGVQVFPFANLIQPFVHPV